MWSHNPTARIRCPGVDGVARAATLTKDAQGHVTGLTLTCWVCYQVLETANLTTLRVPSHTVSMPTLRARIDTDTSPPWFYVPGKLVKYSVAAVLRRARTPQKKVAVLGKVVILKQ
jgi:hypothetical protein